MNTHTYNQALDCRGLNCPLPILKTNQTIAKMEAGEVLKVEASDPGSVSDMKAWSKQTGNELITHGVAGDIYTYFIKKATP